MKKIFTAIFLFIAIIFKPNFSNATANVQDSLALVDLYNSTNGPHWQAQKNWLTAKPLTTWAGVTIKNKRVVELRLIKSSKDGYQYNNFLEGDIPASFGNLTELTYLNLSDNFLTSLPNEIGNLRKLHTLILYTNNFIELPPTLGNLIDLSYLDVSNNQITNINTSWGKLVNLNYINLSRNQISNIPASLGNIINLHHLDLSFNQIKKIPGYLGNLINLTDLNLYHSKIEGSIPPQLGNLINLQSLILTANHLTGNIPSELGNLINLTEIGLNDNRLSGNIPPELGNLKNLHDLYLTSNKLTGHIPGELSNLNIKTLDLSHNKLSGSIPESFAKLQATWLRLNDNNLSGKIPELKSTQLLNVKIWGNEFTFAGLINLIRNVTYVSYSPQAHIPIHINGNILSVYTGGSYQLTLDTFKWYKNGTLVATIIGDSNFVVNEDGAYNVTVHNSVATKLTLYSDTINYTAGNNAIASKMNNHSSISVFPNPAKTNATISFSADGKYSIVVTDFSGKVLQTKIGVAIKGSNTIQLDVSNYASGVYLITITDEKNKKQTIKLSKE